MVLVGDGPKLQKPWIPYAVTLIATWLLIGPRISLLNVAGSSVRVEDAFLALLWVYVLARWRSILVGLPRRNVTSIAWIGVVASVLAFMTGRVTFGPALLYSIRPLEYWIVFPAMYFVLCQGTQKFNTFFFRILALITLIQVGTAALQTFTGLSLGFSKFSAERGAGLTAGPYELGAICSMLGVYWFMCRKYLLAAVAVCGVFLAASRISILGLAIGGLIALIASRKPGNRSPDSTRRRLVTAGVGSVVIAASVSFLLLNPMSSEQLGSPVVDRLQSTSTIDAWNTSGEFASGLELPENAADYDLLAYGDMPYLLGDGGFATGVSGEASDMVRFFRWHVLIDLLKDPGSILFGLGPSFAGASVDGSYLRMAAETGVVGLLVWMTAIRGWTKNLAPPALGAIVALLVGAVFIDVVYSLRTMVLLWVLIASNDAIAHSGSRKIVVEPKHFGLK